MRLGIVAACPTLVFISYAHEDEELLKELQTHLSVLSRSLAVHERYDHDIEDRRSPMAESD